MKIIDVLQALEKIAPLSLSNEFCQKYGAYDNSGIIIDTDKDITGVVFSLDLTNFLIVQSALPQAEERMIQTRHI